MFHTWKVIRMNIYIWLNFLTIVVFKASKEMKFSYGFTIGNEDILFVMIILEENLLRLELVEMTIKNIS